MSILLWTGILSIVIQLTECKNFAFVSLSPKLKEKKVQMSAIDDPRALNEFSRPLRTPVVLSPRRKEYSVSIQANEEELGALSKRFSLSHIEKLEADLILTRGRSGHSSSDGDCISIEGRVISAVKQTCVRTNEEFDVDLEFDLNSVVRATQMKPKQDIGDIGGMNAAEIEAVLNKGATGKRKKKGARRKAASGFGSRQNLNDMKIREIEGMLQDFDYEDDVVEDESVFASDGILDVGELVAQMFRLKLDPYPKKPGSQPVRYSISG